MDLSEVKRLVEDQGKAWEQFQKTNDERLSKLAKGESVTDLESKLNKANEELTEIGKELKELTLKSQRPGVQGDTKEAAQELDAFNAKCLATAMEKGRTFTPMDAKQYTDYKAAIKRYFRVGADGQKMSPEEIKAINVGTASDGGFLVGEEMEGAIERVVARYGAMRQVANVRPLGQAVYKKLVKVRGTTGAKRGNENTKTQEGGQPQWVELEFKPGTYLSEQRITAEALEDIVQDIEGDLLDEMGIEFAEKEGADCIDGDGTNGPRGLLSYEIVPNNSWAWGKLGYVKTGKAAGFADTAPSDVLIDVQHALKRQYRGNAAWFMNDGSLGSIRRLKDANGLYLWAPSGLLNGVAGQLLGHAVVTDDFMPDLGAGAFPIAFGDFKRGYTLVDRKGISVLRDPYTAAPHVKFLGRRRVGGGVSNFEAIKLLKCEA